MPNDSPAVLREALRIACDVNQLCDSCALGKSPAYPCGGQECREAIEQAALTLALAAGPSPEGRSHIVAGVSPPV